ncbi:hypothetical protein AXX17_AT2G07370 [Arabidopsis thaliana]|uniref:Uncharacterized protein n=1 Tax=Arabidopsis thaliana TaxID=3702 RepID=A0A178VR63_ARATH|nr:hypothetical protein AXX17_AT2G07370 [Arabidopsis thaliana]
MPRQTKSTKQKKLINLSVLDLGKLERTNRKTQRLAMTNRVIRADVEGVLRDKDGQAYNKAGQRLNDHGLILLEDVDENQARLNAKYLDVQLLGTFFGGVNWRYHMALDAARNGNFNTRYPTDATTLIENLACSNSNKNADFERKKIDGAISGNQMAEVNAKLDSVHNLLTEKKHVHFAAEDETIEPEPESEEGVFYIDGQGYKKFWAATGTLQLATGLQRTRVPPTTLQSLLSRRPFLRETFRGPMVITDDPMDVFHTPLESHDSYKDDAKEGNPIFDTGVKDPNGNDADDEGKIQDTLETVEASLSVLETQPEENIDDDPMREETLETVEASHSMLETQPEENIDDDPMMKVTLEAGAASQSVVEPQPDDPMETQPEVNIDGDPLKVYNNNKYHFMGCGSCVIGQDFVDNMETAAASHSLLETQREVNIDGNISYIYSNQLHVYFNIQVIVEILAASHSVSEAQPEVKIGNDAMGDTMETPPTSHSLLGFAMFSEKKVTVDMAAAIHSGVCEVNSDPMKAMVVFGSLYLIQVPKLTKSPNHLSHIVPIVWVQETRTL